jgi:hypothetical protein
VVSELVVDGGEGLELVLGLLGILLVDEDLEELGLVSANASALADDLGREDDVVEDRGVNGREGARAGALDALEVSDLRGKARDEQKQGEKNENVGRTENGQRSRRM